ncbi:MAG: hypothetical protein IT323_23065, partial [Anaerolineae bacterium]|nr:hypothetical protein [Anaerolineae bacterium]
ATPSTSPKPSNTPTPEPSDTPTPTEPPVAVRFTAGVPILDPTTRQFIIALVVLSGGEQIARFHVDILGQNLAKLGEFDQDAPLDAPLRVPIPEIEAQTVTLRVSAQDAAGQNLYQQTLQARYITTPVPGQATPTRVAALVSPTPAPPAETPTPIPLPPGTMPYNVDMENADALAGWDANPDAWQIQPVGANAVLVAVGSLDDLAMIMGREQPAWDKPEKRALVMEFDINLAEAGSIGRLIFRHSDAGYYALEISPGFLSFRRGSGEAVNRSTERALKNLEAPLNWGAGEYHHLLLWTDSGLLYLYLDRVLTMTVDDPGDVLPGGSIILQNVNVRTPVRYDNLKILEPLGASSHFRAPGWPASWSREDNAAAQLRADARGNAFIELSNTAVRPDLPRLGSMTMSCRLYSVQGGFDVRVRDSESGYILFEFIAGNLTLNQYTADGTRITLQSFPNSWGRGQFFQFDVDLLDGEVRFYRAGRLVAEHRVDNLPAAGDIVFSTRSERDIMRLTDCLFTETRLSQSEAAAWAFEKVQQVETRRIRDLLSEWYEDFDDRFRTREWWAGGANAPGEFVRDGTDRDHSTYLRMDYTPGAAWRIFNDGPTFYAFGAGRDTTGFYDSSDIYLRVDVRVPERGAAWIAARTRLSNAGALDGVFLYLVRKSSTEFAVRAEVHRNGEVGVVYDGPLPLSVDRAIPDWIPLLVVTYHDQAAFFANERFLGEALSIPVLNGS